MLETSELSVGVLMILYLRAGDNQNIFVGKSDEGLNIYTNFSKIVIEGIGNVRWISDCFIVNFDSSGKCMAELF